MPNFLYKNLNEIFTTRDPIRGVRIVQNKLGRNIIVPRFDSVVNPEDPTTPSTNIEFHVFLPNGAYVDTLYSVEYGVDIRDENNETFKYVILDVHDHLEQTKIIPGPYKVVYNFFRNLIGSNSNDSRLFISDISLDRRELQLSLTKPNDEFAQGELSDFVLQYLRGSKFLLPIVLNFGENNIVDVINVTSNGEIDSFFVRLYEPLPADVDLFYECWLSSQIMKPYIDNVLLYREEESLKPSYISGPNYEVDTAHWVSTETDYRSWNDLLQTNVQTSQELLNKYILDSGSIVKLNLDFTDFKNFIFYSSAEERVENFYYKIQLIENYNSQLSLLETYTGSLDTNKTNIKLLREKVVSGFDDFEKFLYYETTSSFYYTTQSSAPIQPFPKYEVTSSVYHLLTKEGKFNLHSTTSSAVEDWYNNILDIATDYDMSNYNSLDKSIPEHIFENKDNEQFITFVRMIGQHFDILYYYADHILKKNLRTENPRDGLSQDLIYEATKNLGWTLSQGSTSKELWEYALGLSGSGEPIWTGRTTVSKEHSKSVEERTKEVWRRIFNNLPYIYKTKGTARSVKALLAAYGIPQTILTIREFGGPDNADLGIKPRAEWEKHTYYLNFRGSYPLPTNQHYVSVPWEKVNNSDGNWQYPDTLTFRWKMEPEDLYSYTNDPIQTVLQKVTGSRLDWFVTIHKDGTDIEKGSLNFYLSNGTNYATASITDEYLFDDVPLNIMIQRSTSNDSISVNQKYDFILKTAKYGKIAVERSASIVVTGSISSSYNNAWASNGDLYIGSGSNPQTDKILSGSIFELRYWTRQLNSASFDNHVIAPRSYNGNTATSSYYDLQGQWKFWQKFDTAVTTSLFSSHPNQNKNTFQTSSKNAYLYGFTSSSFESITETYNMEVASVGIDTPFAEKVRIDSASLIGPLSKDETFTLTAFDRYSQDSNKLMVAFSPQHIINEDIYEAIGSTWIDDYFGDYSNVDAEEYTRLKWFAREYWQKYNNRNDFNAYISLISKFDFGVFDQIRQTLPARVNEILGLVIEPNVLERSKVKIAKDFYAEPPTKFVKDVSELSKLGIVTTELNQINGTVFIGFDEEIPSEADEFESDTQIVTEMEADTQNLEDDMDFVTKFIVTPQLQNMTIPITGSIGGIFEKKDAIISASNRLVEGIITSYDTKISNLQTMFGYFNKPLDIDYAELKRDFTNTYARRNIKFGINPNTINYGKWYYTDNAVEKTEALFQQIEKYSTDTYYSGFKFYYSGDNYEKYTYSSFQYVTSSLTNPHNHNSGKRRQQYEGCKNSGGITYIKTIATYNSYDEQNDSNPIIIYDIPTDSVL